jgi:hypothetical protein
MTKISKIFGSSSLLVIFSGEAYADIGPGMNEGLAIIALYPLFLLILPIAAKKGMRWLWFLVTLIGYPISTFFIFLLRIDYQFYTTVAKSIALWIFIFLVLVVFRFIKTTRDTKK